jgi:hypothetical protein
MRWPCSRMHNQTSPASMHMLCLRCGHYERGERIGAWFWPLRWNRATYPARHVFCSANLASLDAGCWMHWRRGTCRIVLWCACLRARLVTCRRRWLVGLKALQARPSAPGPIYKCRGRPAILIASDRPEPRTESRRWAAWRWAPTTARRASCRRSRRRARSTDRSSRRASRYRASICRSCYVPTGYRRPPPSLVRNAIADR